jgi:toxin ParE1/3/4
MKLRYAPRAKADIADVHAYIAERNPKAATAVVRRMRATANLLARYPGVGRATDIPRIRVLPAPPFPYLIYYTQTAKEIVIVHVRHGTRDAPRPEDF